MPRLLGTALVTRRCVWLGPHGRNHRDKAFYSRFTASSVFPWQQATEVTRYGCVSSSCTGLGTPVSSSFLPRRPLAPFPHVHTSPSAEGYEHLTSHLPWPQQKQRPARACCSPRRGGFSLTCSNGHSEGISTSHHGDLHRLEPHNQVGHAAVAAGVGAQLSVLVAPKGVTVTRGWQQRGETQLGVTCETGRRKMGKMQVSPLSEFGHTPSPVTAAECAVPMSAHTMGSWFRGADWAHTNTVASSTWSSGEGSSAELIRSRPSLLHLHRENR